LSSNRGAGCRRSCTCLATPADISAGDLLRQALELDEGRKVDYAHLTDTLRQKEPSLLEKARGLNRESRHLVENAGGTLELLDKRRGRDRKRAGAYEGRYQELRRLFFAVLPLS